MKFFRLFLLFVLFLPILVHASSKQGECEQHLRTAISSWNASEAITTKCHTILPDQKEECIKQLYLAISNCDNAVIQFNSILSKIFGKKQDWHANYRDNVPANLQVCKDRINQITDWINQLKSELIFEKLQKDKKQQFSYWIDQADQKKSQVDSTPGLKRANDLKIVVGAIQQAIIRYNDLLREASAIGNQNFQNTLVSFRDQIQKVIDDNQKTISFLQTEIVQSESYEVLLKVQLKYDEALDHAKKAQEIVSRIPIGLKEIKNSTLFLEEVIKSYQNATRSCHEAISYLIPFPQFAEYAALTKIVSDFEASAKLYQNQLQNLPGYETTQLQFLQEKLAYLTHKQSELQAKGLTHNCYEIQKQIVPILEELVDFGKENSAELTNLKKQITAFEIDFNAQKLTTHQNNESSFSPENFWQRERKLQENFFKNLPFHQKKSQDTFKLIPQESFVLPLDGQIYVNEGFLLYSRQFYRFLIRKDSPLSNLKIKVFENNQCLYEETLVIPPLGKSEWDQGGGSILFPNSNLKKDFGLDLRLSQILDTNYNFVLLCSHKSLFSNYRFEVLLDDNSSLYQFSLIESPPWQLEILKKPSLPDAGIFINEDTSKPSISENNFNSLDYSQGNNIAILIEESYPLLDSFVEEMKKDPLAIAQYVYNEIEFSDPFQVKSNDVFMAPPIHRNAFGTFMEKKGSPLEQCALLVYLLRKAGYKAMYAQATHLPIDSELAKRLLLIDPPNKQNVLVNYPWVVFYDGNKWIPLFPWLKNIQINEGHDLYAFLPEEYATAKTWIKHYLTNDERILKHVGPDGDDTAGILFFRFLEEELRLQGLSLNDVGIDRAIQKRQFSSLEDFPKPQIPEKFQTISNLSNQPQLFATIQIEISSRQNPQKSIQIGKSPPIILLWKNLFNSLYTLQ